VCTVGLGGRVCAGCQPNRTPIYIRPACIMQIIDNQGFKIKRLVMKVFVIEIYRFKQV
jgi:hypothetical protein